MSCVALMCNRIPWISIALTGCRRGGTPGSAGFANNRQPVTLDSSLLSESRVLALKSHEINLRAEWLHRMWRSHVNAISLLVIYAILPLRRKCEPFRLTRFRTKRSHSHLNPLDQNISHLLPESNVDTREFKMSRHAVMWFNDFLWFLRNFLSLWAVFMATANYYNISPFFGERSRRGSLKVKYDIENLEQVMCGMVCWPMICEGSIRSLWYFGKDVSLCSPDTRHRGLV